MKEIFSIPNCISFLRLALMPVYVVFTLKADSDADYLLSSLFLLALAATDLLDGYIARKYNMVTEFGKVLDPVADKCFQLAILICLLERVPGMVVVLAVFLVKELIMLLFAAYFLLRYHRKMDGAMWCGKICTAVMFIVTFIMALLPPLPDGVYYVLEAVMIACQLFVFVYYTIFYYHLYKNLKA